MSQPAWLSTLLLAYDFKLLVSAEGHLNTTMEDGYGDASDNGAVMPEAP